MVGETLDITSVVKLENGTIKEIKTLDNIANNILINITFILLRYICLFQVVIAKANAFIGFNIGEISIAHITTGIEFISKPNVAIIQESINCIQ